MTMTVGSRVPMGRREPVVRVRPRPALSRNGGPGAGFYMRAATSARIASKSMNEGSILPVVLVSR